MAPSLHSMINRGFDLSAAFAGVPINDKRYGSIVQALRGLESVVSTQKDLEEARQALDSCAVANPEKGEQNEAWNLIRHEAVFVHALILYCRATHSGSKARSKLDFIGSYTADQKKAHKLVTGVRDRIIAHYGAGEEQPGGSWNKDHVVLWLAAGRYSYTYPSMRVAHKAAVVRMLADLISAAIQRAISYGSQRQDRLMTLLQVQLQSDSALRARLEPHVFDAATFFVLRPTAPGEYDRFSVPADLRPFVEWIGKEET